MIAGRQDAQHLRLVPPQAPPAEPAPHPDTRAGAARLAAWRAGYEAAERYHHLKGWRSGVGHGLLAGILLGALAMHAGTELAALIRALP